MNHFQSKISGMESQSGNFLPFWYFFNPLQPHPTLFNTKTGAEVENHTTYVNALANIFNNFYYFFRVWDTPKMTKVYFWIFSLGVSYVALSQIITLYYSFITVNNTTEVEHHTRHVNELTNLCNNFYYFFRVSDMLKMAKVFFFWIFSLVVSDVALSQIVTLNYSFTTVNNTLMNDIRNTEVK